MTKFDSAETPISKRTDFAKQALIVLPHDDSRQGFAGRRTLYVLGFGIAGAILANMVVFFYFASFYASG